MLELHRVKEAFKQIKRTRFFNYFITNFSIFVFNFHTDQHASTNNRSSAPVIPAADTMYTNMANLQQTMLLQQRLFLQALCQNSQMGSPSSANPTERTAMKDENGKKHFTAPSLSQYRFVSGQQVSVFTCFLDIFLCQPQ